MNVPIDVKAWIAREIATQSKINNINKERVFEALKQTPITRIEVRFDGQGDTGQIEEVEAYSEESTIALPQVKVLLQTRVYNNSPAVDEQADLRQAIENLCHGYLEEKHGGWENNEGAYGTFEIDVAEEEILLDYDERVTTTNSFHQKL